jgi:hypothetical protein
MKLLHIISASFVIAFTMQGLAKSINPPGSDQIKCLDDISIEECNATISRIQKKMQTLGLPSDEYNIVVGLQGNGLLTPFNSLHIGVNIEEEALLSIFAQANYDKYSLHLLPATIERVKTDKFGVQLDVGISMSLSNAKFLLLQFVLATEANPNHPLSKAKIRRIKLTNDATSTATKSKGKMDISLGITTPNLFKPNGDGLDLDYITVKK